MNEPFRNGSATAALRLRMNPGGAQAAAPKRLSRQIVLRELLKAGGPIRAYELARRLQRRMARRVSVNSVYRILAMLELNGLIGRVECLKAWVALKSGSGPRLYLICSGCGAARSMFAPELSGQLERLARSRSFSAQRLVLETLGLCDRCSSQAPSVQE